MPCFVITTMKEAAKDSIKDYLYFYRKGFCYNAAKKFDSALSAAQPGRAVESGLPESGWSWDLPTPV